jgi:type II secretory pathway component PulL
LKGAEIGKALYTKIEGETPLEQDLARLLDPRELRHDLLVSCLSSASSHIRQMVLPLKKPAKIEKVIKYQMEPYVPYPVDDLVVDFLLGRSGELVTAAAVLKKTLSEHLQMLSAAGSEPQGVGVDDLALAALLLRAEAPEAEKRLGVLNLQEDKMSLQILGGGELHFIRVTAPGAEPLVQVADALRFYQAKHSGKEVASEFLLVGDRLLYEGLAEKMASELGVGASWWRPFDRFPSRCGEIPGDVQAGAAVALALALSGAGGSGKAINLRKEEFRVRSGGDPKRPLAVMACGLILLSGLLTFDVYRKLHGLESRNEALRQQTADLYLKAFPGGGRVVKGQELFQMEQKIRENTARFQALGDGKDQAVVLDMLSILSKILSEFRDARVENLSLDGKEIRLDGQAESFEQVDRIKEMLSASERFEGVKLAGAKMDKKANAVKFNFSMEWK